MRNFPPLSSLLGSLCDNAPWSYAVFWKLKHERNKILTCEDGCFYDVKASVKVEETQYGEPAIKPICYIHDDQDGTLADLPIKVALESMSSHVYLMGHGIIGKAALEKRHYWISAGDVSYKSLFEHHGDWQFQLAAGIKTILLVPVVKYGVVQFGSLNMVAEDFKMVAHIRSLFSDLYHQSLISSSSNSFFDCSSTFSPLYTSNMEKRPMATDGLFVPQNSKHSRPVESNLFSVMDASDFLLSQDVINDQALELNKQLLARNEEPFLLNNPSNAFGGVMSKLIITEHEMENNVQAIIDHRPYPEQIDSFFENQVSWSNLTLYDAETTFFEGTESSNFPIYLESHNALGLTKMGKPDSCFLDTAIPKASMILNSVSSLPTIGCETDGFSFGESHSGYFRECDGDNLLEAVVNGFRRQPHDTTPDNKSDMLSSYSSENLIQSCLTHSTKESTTFKFEASICDAEGIASSLASGSKSTDRLANDDQNFPTKEHHCRKPDSKKLRSKSGEKHKPRPRDRQLIQDRIKELRGLIPNGSNCSIDALLDKTVRHMLFLRGVSAQADKLRRYEDKKVKDEAFDSMKPGNFPNGASWAYEVGSKPANFPLIIENLDQPGQILVEMMCKDYGLFLEIVRVIRHLDLLILKGVLESRSDMLWAHFVIEVSEDFQRTQILWPLMQLVQRNNKYE